MDLSYIQKRKYWPITSYHSAHNLSNRDTPRRRRRFEWWMGPTITDVVENLYVGLVQVVRLVILNNEFGFISWNSGFGQHDVLSALVQTKQRCWFPIMESRKQKSSFQWVHLPWHVRLFVVSFNKKRKEMKQWSFSSNRDKNRLVSALSCGLRNKKYTFIYHIGSGHYIKIHISTECERRMGTLIHSESSLLEFKSLIIKGVHTVSHRPNISKGKRGVKDL